MTLPSYTYQAFKGMKNEEKINEFDLVIRTLKSLKIRETKSRSLKDLCER